MKLILKSTCDLQIDKVLNFIKYLSIYIDSGIYILGGKINDNGLNIVKYIIIS